MQSVSPDELCQRCNHDIDDHVNSKCNGVYNVHDVHGDEQVGCLCKEFSDKKVDQKADISSIITMAQSVGSLE